MQTTELPLEFWLWGSLLVSLIAAATFGAGVFYAHLSLRMSLRRTQQSLSTLVEQLLRSLDQAGEACGSLEGYPGARLTAEQTEQLQTRRSKLLDAVARLLDRNATAEAPPSAAFGERNGRKSAPFSITWLREPTDQSTGLPDRSALDRNLEQLAAACGESHTEAGLLLVKVDRVDQLASRYGTDGVELFARKLGGVLCRSLRDADLVCRLSFDTFAVLFPEVDAESGRRLSAKIRSSVLQYHFRLEETGPEVLVTSSFGYARISPDDTPDLVLNRAGDALARSQKLGRNQLHVHTGQTLLYCN